MRTYIFICEQDTGEHRQKFPVIVEAVSQTQANIQLNKHLLRCFDEDTDAEINEDGAYLCPCCDNASVTVGEAIEVKTVDDYRYALREFIPVQERNSCPDCGKVNYGEPCQFCETRVFEERWPDAAHPICGVRRGSESRGCDLLRFNSPTSAFCANNGKNRHLGGQLRGDTVVINTPDWCPKEVNAGGVA